MDKITAKISLTRLEWSILYLCLTHSIPMLPKSCWEVSEGIEKEIENALEIAKEEN